MQTFNELRTTLGQRFYWVLGIGIGIAFGLFLLFNIPINWPVRGSVAIVSELTAEIQVPETDIALVLPGQPARLNLLAYPGQALPAQVLTIGSTATQAPDGAITFPVLVRIEPQANITLRPGMTGTAEVIIARDNAIYVFGGRVSRALLNFGR